MKTFSEISENTMSVPGMLVNHQHYLAHIHPGKEAETLADHIWLTQYYACLLVEQHGLDGVIDKLILDVMGQFGSVVHQEEVSVWLKKMFVETIVFHDFGKVNENFQTDRMRNRQFRPDRKSVLNPVHGHSFLGAYLSNLIHADAVIKSDVLNEREKFTLIVISYFFSYTIGRHHCSYLECVTKECFFSSFIEMYDDLEKYVKVLGLSLDREILKNVLGKINLIWGRLKNEEMIQFSLFALLKLDYSLLTASDYLATYEYMSGKAVSDMGVFQERSRVDELISNLRDFKHNRETYAHVEDFEFVHPVEKSNKHLNLLRREMAVELIQTIRKNVGKRLFYIEAPTGGGKTNMSMIALSELMDVHQEINKVFYVFPFTTLITQTYQSLQMSFGLNHGELVELYSKAPLNDKEGEGKEDGVYGDKQKDFIDNLFALYPVTVLSHVKFFDVLKTNRKEENYLLHRMSNSVVIIDELQSYDPKIWDKMLYLISQYADFFNMRFILMSATLPKIGELDLKSRDGVDFVELLPNVKLYQKNANFAKRVDFRFDLFQQEIDLSFLAGYVIEKSYDYQLNHSSDGTVHTIIEFIFKKSASDFFRLVEESEHPFDEILVLSGTILEPRRKEVIHFIKNPDNQNKNILLITTQVVEAGVDIDMDLGFKNVSLIDSDEQLAGRVNRNATKEFAEVYLFKLDDASVLYGNDDRYVVTKNDLGPLDHERILKEKDFAGLYALVLGKIDWWNRLKMARNFQSEFIQDGIQRLDYVSIDRQFQIINQRNESVFVPLMIPVKIVLDESGACEDVVQRAELDFLQRFGVTPVGGKLDGREVWQVYETLILSGKKGFDLDVKVDFKILQGIMSKFTFSLLCRSKDYQDIRGGLGEEKYGYLYFSHWDDDGGHGMPYDYKSGLNDKSFDDVCFI